MRLVARPVNLEAGGKYIVILNKEDADFLGLHALDRVSLRCKDKELAAIVDITTRFAMKGEMITNDDVTRFFGIKGGEHVEVSKEKEPESIFYIKQKISGCRLEYEKIKIIVNDITERKLSDIELTALVTTLYTRGISIDEAVGFSRAMVNAGKRFRFNKHVICDKHCLPADMPTIVRNSGNVKVENIGTIIDSVFERCNPNEIYTDGVAEFTDKNLNNLHVLSHDDKGEVDFVPVSAVYRLNSPKHLREIKLLGNRVIRTTDNHTIFVFKSGNIENISVNNIKVGDYVLVPTKIRNGKIIKEISLKTDFNNKCGCKKIKDNIKITPEFMRLLGYYISEGFTNYQGIFLNFGSHEKKLIEDAKKCVKYVFETSYTINKPHKTAVRISVYSQMLSEIFERTIKAGSNALEKKIPSFIFDVEDSMKIEFLKALFNGDGYKRRGYEAIYVTSSKKLATQLQYLLSSLGISVSLSVIKEGEREFPKQKSKIHESYYVYTQAREIFGGRKKDNVAFINLLPIRELGDIETRKIGWEFRREFKRQKYMTKQKLKRIINYIKSEDTKKIINGSISVLRVKSVKSVESTSKYVYDFRVDRYNRFVAGTAPICIHNSIGGMPGDKTSIVLVPILAAAGLIVPKTSSRAITSPAGTADRMEVLAPVCLSLEEIEEVVKKTGACLVWGGALDLSPADDEFIKIEYPLGIDPMLLPSIMSKKKAIGAKYVVIDIPTGREAKITNVQKARELAEDFLELGKRLGMHIACGITFGEQPLGYCVGPALEAREALITLQGKGPKDVVEKATMLSDMLFNEVGLKDHGAALELLRSGKAEKKMREIIEAQGGNPEIKPENIEVGDKTFKVKSDTEGRVLWIKNSAIVLVAREAGSPKDKGAGIHLNVKMGDSVRKGDVLFTIHSNNYIMLSDAVKLAEELKPLVIGKKFEEEMLLERIFSEIPTRKVFMLER